MNGDSGKNRAGKGESKHSPWKNFKFEHIVVAIIFCLIGRAIYYPVVWILFTCLILRYHDNPAIPVVFGVITIVFGETVMYYLGVPLLTRIMLSLFPDFPVRKRK